MIATEDCPAISHLRIARRGLKPEPAEAPADVSAERQLARRYPLSRWYLRPAAGLLAIVLTPTRIRPSHLTLCGLAAGLSAAGALLVGPVAWPLAGILVLVWWFLDRTDGQLARRQGTVTTLGAWLDANVDELIDLTVHVALCAALVRQTGWTAAWLLLIAFLAGKYLFMYGLALEEPLLEARDAGSSNNDSSRAIRWLRAAYHFPANADVRVHLLVACLFTGWLIVELAAVAVYYNLRWIARYVLVARRLGGTA